ncbi:MAG: hypothetical protein J7498_15075 [Sphingobium sp.]|nr:hypothetical protein [Sphingobium sp.]
MFHSTIQLQDATQSLDMPAIAARVPVRGGLTPLHRQVIRLSLGDQKNSLKKAGRMMRIAMRLTGDHSRKNSLADPRLEAPRRYAILYRLNGSALDETEQSRIAEAGFDALDRREIRAFVDRHVAGSARLAGKGWSSLLPVAALVAITAILTTLMWQVVEDLMISTIVAGFLSVTLVSLHRPSRHA